ncbi:hypothetical protein [Mucilaginibacter segetis]|uniref:Uncharacterized protein n=1 Tax=Mucilaginibacter segetis TaxID=2793071 RepID=A0A934PXA2_9SPHI|nr:hypothetical protein [Mucilaginibacter segetis]MBK0380728.1 hypothetical protein [Mucilaginibacter segetis]
MAVTERKPAEIVYLPLEIAMEEPDLTIFSNLYREAYTRCFGQLLTQPLTETEGKLFYQQILDQTGLTIGWRTLKNYSLFILDGTRQDNPSIASMDTLARYVLKAPYTNEIERKDNEGHHPYWFMYRNRYLKNELLAVPVRKKYFWWPAIIALFLILTAFFIWIFRNRSFNIDENFADVTAAKLIQHGWQVKNKDERYWHKRDTIQGGITLFTLPGDNWPDGTHAPAIKNLLLTDLPNGCFITELQMQDFIPSGEWQQAGLLLMEDTTFNSPSIRISLAYNDFFGGFKRPKEVIVQAIYSPGGGRKPEEFAHAAILTPDSSAVNPVLLSNLKHTALRIEKQGVNYRFLYAGGAAVNTAFKQLAARSFAVKPNYIGIFAIKGWVNTTKVAPVHIKRFLLQSVSCE